ncbi:MAG: hypothetical protein ACI9TH_000613 [Kiritimatiellia bacterium]|jgi:hypothetical protein
MRNPLRCALFPLLIAVASGQELADQVIPRVVLPNGNALMQGVRDRLPDEPIHIQATLKTVKSVRFGPDKISRVKAESLMDFGADIPHGSYIIYELDGVPIEKAEVQWVAGDTRFTYYAGADLVPQTDFKPSQSLKSAPFTWHDLSLAFLWWPEATTVRQDSYMQVRKVWIVDLAAPPALQAAYSGVRLKIDQVELLVHEVEVYDPKGEKIREIKMKGLQELDGMYMFKDMAITSWPGAVKTSILVKNLVRGGAPIDEDIPSVTPVPLVP